jgi:hypothetical protein
MKTLRWLLLSLSVGLLAACNVPVEPSEAEVGAGYDTVRSAIELIPGERNQGTALHGSSLESVSFSPAYHEGRTLMNLRLVEGGLVAEAHRKIEGTTPSLTPCVAPASGQARSCGLSSMGVGLCRPGTTVKLGGGACGTGTCSGDPVVRVCSGKTPCEYGAATMLVSGDDACGSYCPEVTFVCPAGGNYNVLAGAYQSGNAWSVDLVPSTGAFPAIETLSGEGLEGAKLHGQAEDGSPMTLTVEDIANASQKQGDETANSWDPSGKTWLYRLRYRTALGQLVDLCAGSPDLPYAVPVGGLYDAGHGGRSESSTAFTFGCHNGVIAKCYRWGYQPWKDAVGENRMKHGHAACTRMARADYCGNGEEHTQDNTRIVPWDNLAPQPVILHPDQVDPLMVFEGGWTPSGAKCLNHWRWANMPASCPWKLTPPQYGANNELLNRCQPGQTEACASVCENATDAQAMFGTRVFNKSLTTNGP